MSDAPKIIKKFEPVECPHCKEQFYIGSHTMMSTIVSTITATEALEIKKEIKEQLKEIKFNNKQEEATILKYIDDENVLFDRTDIDKFVKQVAMDQVQKLSEKNVSNKN